MIKLYKLIYKIIKMNKYKKNSKVLILKTKNNKILFSNSYIRKFKNNKNFNNR
jgi:hypothetical protein